MDAITALHQRTSSNLLESPGPTSEQIDTLIRAGLRACDHKGLRPWRFVLIEGDRRQQFGELLVTAKTAEQDGCPPPIDLATKLRNKALRAPAILAVAAEISSHEKVPEIEQLLSAGASAQMIMTAAYSLGLGAIWRSGSLMFQDEMREGLGLSDNCRLVGFIYLGTPKITKPTPTLDPKAFLRHW